MRKLIFLLFSIISTIFFSFNSLEAISIIRVDQAKIRIIVPLGSSKTGVINIDNTTDYPKYIKVYLEDWYYLPSADGSKEFLPAGTTELSCANWISFYPAEFTIPPFGRQKINYTVRVPQEAKGGHYAILFIEESGAKAPNEEGVSVGLAIRVGCLFYVEPEGTIKRTAQLYNLNIEKSSRDKQIEISVDFKNTGNTDISTSGNFSLIDKKGMVYARGEFNDAYTFSGDTAKLTTTWKKPIPKGRYDLVITLDLGKALEELRLGRGPIIVKEAEIEIDNNGEIIKVGDLR